MPLDPQVKLVLDNLPDDLLDVRTTTPLELRKMYEGQTRLPFPVEPVASVEERSLPGPDGEIPVRVYTPDGPGPRPGIVFFHGGGWVIGNLDTHDGTVRKLANASGCTIGRPVSWSTPVAQVRWSANALAEMNSPVIRSTT